VILQRSRFVLVAAFVVIAAFLSGFGALLTGAQPVSRTPSAPSPPATPRHSGDDGGFSVVLTEPGEPYLVGVRRIVIEPQVPAGDTMVGADFFVDGRLVATHRRAPYETQMDFGQEIRRHTIIVTALTAGGRRAKVSFISRAADLAGEAATPIVLVPAVVRDAGGHYVDGLSMGDFILLEDGTRQPIVHFDGDPIPQSIAVGLQACASDPVARAALLRGAASFAESVPSYHALGLVTVGTLQRAEGAVPARTPAPLEVKGKAAATTAALPSAEFSYDHGLFGQRLADLDGKDERGRPLAEGIRTAARGLQTRPRGRVLVLLLCGSGPREMEAGLMQGPPAPPAAPPPLPGDDEDLADAFDAIRRSGAVLQVVVYGGTETPPFPSIKKAAEDSGGEFLVAASAPAVEAAGLRISESLRHQYLVGFAPPSPDRQGMRSIELRLRPPALAIRARKSYFAEQTAKKP